MRISTSMIYGLGSSAVSTQLSDLVKLQTQISSNKRINTPSDDPLGAARVLEISASKSQVEQFTTNGSAATTALDAQAGALSSFSDTLNEIRSLAVQAGDRSLTQNDRNAVATELQGKYQFLLGLANTSENGKYLFSGFKGETQPFSEISPGVVVYNGDQGQRLVQIAAGRQVPVSSAGVEIFQRIKNGNGTFVTSQGTSGVLAGTTPVGLPLAITAANNTLNVTVDGAAVSATIANGTYATGAALASAIQTAINNNPTALAAGKKVSVSVDSANQLTITSNSTGASSSVTGLGGTAAAALFPTSTVTAGTSNTGTGVIGPGSVVDASKWNTAGNTQNYKIVFAQDTASAPAVTTYDIVTNVQTVVNGVTYNAGDSLLTGAPSAAVASASGGPRYPRVYTEGQTISFQTQAGDTNPNPPWNLGIEANVTAFPTSTPTTSVPLTNSDSFTIKQSSNNQDIFKTVYDLVNALKSGPGADLSNQVSATLANLDHAEDSVLTATSNVGVSLAEVETYKNANADTVLQQTTDISNIQDLDVAKAYSDLAKLSANLQASQKSFLTVQGLSLFNYINP